MLDLKIAGGTVVDGTGREAFRGDVGVSGGKIVEVGDVSTPARRTIDAAGALVVPGFVDLHAHYDGQVSWDDELAPSILHGVTTTVIGNCGVGFAPVRASDRERLIALMEGVEDIPGSALSEGIRWEWESFPEYMDALDRTPRTIDVMAQVPHDALRVFVMGDRAIAGEPATPDDVAAMRAALRESLERGAVGFSTGRTDNHRGKDGSATPSSEADRRELDGLASAFEGLDHGVLQAVSDFDMAAGKERFDQEYDFVESMARVAKRPMSISLLQRVGDSEQWRRVLGRVEKSAASGLEVKVQVAPRAIGVLLGFEATFHPFMGFPSYKAVQHLPLEERVRHLANPEVKARLLEEKSERVAGDGSAIPPLADQLLANLDFVSMSLFRLGARPDYEPKREDSLFGEAARRGVRPLEVVYDALLERDGTALLYFPIYNYAAGNLDEVGEMLRHPLALFGLGDGGAHVGTICDASFPTFLLTHWARDRKSGKVPVERAIQMLTGAPAGWLGLDDRGSIAPGKRADINVIDFERLALPAPRLVRDLPAGGRRLLQDAEGYRATIVAGETVRDNGKTTDARPGRVVRAGGRRRP
ncbi:MAG: amidohydrolase family protein [Polyangiaceae bacterium]|nr:amidohydrolase family protein [Polyangiaceae bacterium]